MTPTCPTCDRQLTPAAGGGEAEHGTVSGTLDAASVFRCPEGHVELRADVAAALEEVHAALDIAERTRLRNTLRCAACKTPFALPGRRATRSVTLVATGLPVTRITFDLPLLRCTEDAVESLPPECVDDLDAVVTELLRSHT